jgi:hypothetical protein
MGHIWPRPWIPLQEIINSNFFFLILFIKERGVLGDSSSDMGNFFYCVLTS